MKKNYNLDGVSNDDSNLSVLKQFEDNIEFKNGKYEVSLHFKEEHDRGGFRVRQVRQATDINLDENIMLREDC